MATETTSRSRSVSRVDAFGDSGGAVSRELVRCPRVEGSIPAERCLACKAATCLDIADNGQLVSITCDYDVPGSEPKQKQNSQTISLRRMSVGDLMSRNVVCVRPDLSLDAAVQLFLETGLKSIPVVSEQGRVLGMADESELQLAIQTSSADPLPATRSISDVMMPSAFAIHEQTSATQAAGMMVCEGVWRVPVVSSDGLVVGVISASDLLYWVARSDGYVLRAPGRDAP